MQVINPTCHLIDAKDKTFDLDLISKETTKYKNDAASIKKTINKMRLKLIVIGILDVAHFRCQHVR